MKTISFDQLPEAVHQLSEKLCKIESLLLDKRDVNNSPPPDIILDVSGAGKLLKLTTPTIYSKCSRGELPFMKRSNRIYFSEKELREYLKAGRVKTHLEIEAEADIYLQNSNK